MCSIALTCNDGDFYIVNVAGMELLTGWTGTIIIV